MCLIRYRRKSIFDTHKESLKIITNLKLSINLIANRFKFKCWQIIEIKLKHFRDNTI